MKKITLIITLLLLVQWTNAQDNCASALPITAGLHVISTIDGTQVPTPICADNGAITSANPRGEWYSYTPTGSYTVTVTTSLTQNNPLVDTRFHVYTGTCSTLTCYAGDDDSGNNYSSTSVFNVTAGTTYYIAFDNRWTSSGFTFQLMENPLIVIPPSPITFTSQNIPTINSNYNLCAVDMNNDQRDDIVGVSTSNIRIHFQNANGTFTVTDFPTSAATYTPSWSIAAGDYNKDGYNDLLYGSGSGLTFMKSNSTGTGYTQDTPGEYIFCQRTNFIDINNDGHLDAFSCHDVDPNVYYLNNGNGTFTYYQSGVGGAYELGVASNGGNYGSIWIDYDNDGDQDMFIAKCGSVPPDELHRNNGNGTFSDISVEMNLYDAGQSWSSAWADYDNDGDMDVLVGASSGAHKLKRNNLDTTNAVEEPFTDVTAGSGWDANTSTNIEHIAYDFDNDGFVDFMGGGNKIMFNQGDGTFAPVPYTGLSVGAVADFNSDGFLDIQNGNQLKINSGNANHWITINLQGIESNSNGIGARVEIYGTWGKQIRDIRSGEGFKYMSTLGAHFGIGSATEIAQVIIRWPSGTVDVILNPPTDQPLFVLEGAFLQVDEFSAAGISLYPNPANDFINIKMDSDTIIRSVKVYDITGKLLMTSIPTENKITVQTLSRGTYIVLLEDGGGKQFASKFIKN